MPSTLHALFNRSVCQEVILLLAVFNTGTAIGNIATHFELTA